MSSKMTSAPLLRPNRPAFLPCRGSAAPGYRGTSRLPARLGTTEPLRWERNSRCCLLKTPLEQQSSHFSRPASSLSFLPSVWFGVALGDRKLQATNECNTRRVKLHGDRWEAKRELCDLSEHTPAAKGNAGSAPAGAVARSSSLPHSGAPEARRLT